jgi:hypothetical protein
MQQLTILELVFNENLTPEMKRIYAHDLADLEDSLAKAFDRARCELKFFPKIAELRELAGVSAAVREEHDDVEARAAYQLVIHSLERNGVDAGIKHLPERVQYAVRQCGGLWQFNERLQIRYGGDGDPSFIDNRSPIFLQKDFIAAYKAFTVHKAMLPELTGRAWSHSLRRCARSLKWDRASITLSVASVGSKSHLPSRSTRRLRISRCQFLSH